MKFLKKKYVVFLMIFNIVILSIVFLLINEKDDKKIMANKLKKYQIISNGEKPTLDINDESYSYLPDVIKEEIIEKYDEDGTVILTEKNKIENESYLNPKYVEYMMLPESEKAASSSIPTMLINDYIGTYEADITDATYNLKDENLLNDNKDQKRSSLCWAFAATNSLESIINRKYGEKINLAEKQIDYVTVKDSTVENYNPYYTNRSVLSNEGGTFSDVELSTFKGVSMWETKNMPFSESTTKLELKNIYDSSKLKYIVTGSENFPVLDIPTISKSTSSANIEKYNNYINYIKNSIYTGGSIYVSIASPKTTAGSCYYSDKRIVNWWKTARTTCVSANFPGHAVAITGWDDNYEYSYCADNYTAKNVSESECTGTWISGKGAWIVRNSWGTSNAYFYLAYSSYVDDFGRFTDAVLNTYDNTYDSILFHDKSTNITNSIGIRTTKFFKGEYNEKLSRVSFYTTSSDNKYDIYVSPTGNDSDYILAKENVYKEYPGILSVDLSNLNINITNEYFTVKVVSLNKLTTNINSVTAYTNDNTNTVAESGSTSSLNVKFTSGVAINKSVSIATHTKNIPTGSSLNYEIYDSNNNLINTITQVSNYVIEGKYVSTLTVPYGTSEGTYKIVTKYNNKALDNYATLTIQYSNNVTLNGKGTSSDPFIINNAKEFESINKNLSAYYRLDSDIDFTGYDNWTPIGNEFVFSGHILGNNKTLKNITIKNDDQFCGLFKQILNGSVEDLNISSSLINGNEYVGLLAGYAKNVTLRNINIYDSSVSGIMGTGGLIGMGESMKEIDHIHNESSVSANSFVGGIFGVLVNSGGSYLSNTGLISSVEYGSGGIVGFYNTSTATDTIFNLNNIYNTGTISSEKSEDVGGLFGFLDGNTNVQNAFNTADIHGNTYVGGLFGTLTGYINSLSDKPTINSAYNKGKIYGESFYDDISGYEYTNSEYNQTKYLYKNIYYIDKFDSSKSLTSGESATKVTLNDMHDLSKLPNLDSNVWVIHNNTYPSIKNYDTYFISGINANDINLKVGDTTKIPYTVSPTNYSNKNIEFNNNNKKIINVGNNEVTCLNEGNTTIDILSSDGTNIKKTINVNCNSLISSIAVKTLPNKINYKQFETLDLTGAVLVINFEDNTTKELPITNNMVTGFDSSTIKDNLVLTVNYLNYITTFNVNIKSLVLSVNYTNSKFYTITGDNTVNYGSNYTFTLSKNDKFNYDKMVVLVNNKEVTGNNNVYTITNVTENINITVNGITSKVENDYSAIIDSNNINIIPSKSTFINITKESITKSLDLTSNYKIINSDGKELDNNTTILVTGMKIQTDKIYNIVIRGEITGDGNINQGDVAKLYNYYKGKINITDAYLEAAKIRGYDDINQGDVAKLYNYYKGKISSLES